MKGYFFAVGMIVAAAFQSHAGDEPAAQPSAASLFGALPAFTSVKLSPSGQRVAYIQNISEPAELALLRVYDLEKGKSYNLLQTDNEDVKINWYRWANNNRLVVSAKYAAKGHGQKYYKTRLYSMQYDGESEEPVNLLDWRRLARSNQRSGHIPQFQDSVIDYLPDDEDHILIEVDADAPNLPSVYKVDVNNGKMKRVVKGKRQIRSWFTDQQGKVRGGFALDYDNGKAEILLKEGDDYRTLFEYNAMTDEPVAVMGFGVDPNILYYKAYKEDYKGLYKMDLKTGQSTEVLWEKGHDVDGRLIYSSKTRDAIGVYYAHAEHGEYYWDDQVTTLFNGLNKALPDTTNTVISFSRDESRYILYLEDDNVAPMYLLGDRNEGTLDVIFKQYPQLVDIRIAEHTKVSLDTRDGTQIEGYLSLPVSGKAPYPTVIHPHGGPGARDYASFDYFTAFMNAQGYAVMRPNFRGSTGYGFSFAQSQMKAWGLQMQDDITDTAKWLVKQGIAKEGDMCIVGASYGGYAAMMAAVKTPDLFKCAVSFAGVSNLKRLVIRSRGFTNTEFVKNQIGDDYDDLEKRSPYYGVANIKIPVLLIHGDEDRVVHVEQSQMMAEEMRDENKNVRYVELPGGDHHLSLQKNRMRLMHELDSFLSQHLGD